MFSVQEPSKPVPEANFETGAVVAFLLGGASTLKKYGEKVKGKGARE
jgi:hypothetical protein